MSSEHSDTKRIAIIGADWRGLILACYLAADGHKVFVFDEAADIYKANNIFIEQDYKFEFSPSWFMDQDVVKGFFADFEIPLDDFPVHEKVDVNYKAFMYGEEFVIGALSDTKSLFSRIEPGAGIELEVLLRRAALKHNYILNKGWNYLRLNGLRNKLGLYSRLVDKTFYADRLRDIMRLVPELVFSSNKLPKASLAYNFLDFCKGQQVIKGGYQSLLESIYSIAKDMGVEFRFKKPLQKVYIRKGAVESIRAGGRKQRFEQIYFMRSRGELSKALPSQYKPPEVELVNNKVVWQWSVLLDHQMSNLEFHNVFSVDDQDRPKSTKRRLTKRVSKDLKFYVDHPSRVDDSYCSDGRSVLRIYSVLDSLEYDEATVQSLRARILSTMESYLQLDISKYILGDKEQVMALESANLLSELVESGGAEGVFYVKPPISQELTITQAVLSARKITGDAR